MNERRALASVHLGVLMFGLAALVGKIVDTDPIRIVWWRSLFAAIAIAAAILFADRRIVRPKRIGSLFVLGAILAAHWITFFAAMRIASVTIGLLGFATFPVFVAWIEPWLVPGERFRLSSVALAVVAASGVALLVPSFDLTDTFTLGAATGVLSGLLYAIVVTTNRRLVADTSALELGLWQNAAAVVWLTPFNLGVIVGLPTVRDLGLLLLLGVVLTGFAHVLFVHGMQKVSARNASIIGLLEPVYGVAAASLLLGERAALHTYVGGVVILAAVTVASRTKVNA
ncbi:MAG: DMT family transporter [Deltaproteobacteria bacterium]|jgi:drug/metabolite transporter (DMT)-like permease